MCSSNSVKKLVKCDNFEECGNKEKSEDLIDGLCVSCHEVDPTPTDNECDYCPEVAVRNICGTNLCESCLENYSH